MDVTEMMNQVAEQIGKEARVEVLHQIRDFVDNLLMQEEGYSTAPREPQKTMRRRGRPPGSKNRSTTEEHPAQPTEPAPPLEAPQVPEGFETVQKDAPAFDDIGSPDDFNDVIPDSTSASAEGQEPVAAASASSSRPLKGRNRRDV